jgi:hypothetical protein
VGRHLSHATAALVLLLPLIFTISCGSASTSSASAPSPVKCQVTLGAGSASFSYQGGNGAVPVNTNRDCGWSATASAGWIQLATRSGQGSGEIRYSVRENNSVEDRSGTIETSGARVMIRQAGEPPPPPPPPPPAPPPPPPPDDTPEDPGPEQGPRVDLDGEVSNLIGRCPTLRFRVEGTTVWTTAATEFRKMRCDDMRNGRDVEVEGLRQSDGTVFATRIERD